MRELDQRSFVYYASHDLQEPVRAVTGYARMLAQQLGSEAEPESQYLVGQILLATAEMTTLLRDLLDYMDLGERRLILQPVNTADVLQKAKSDLAREIQQAEARVERGELPWVYADVLSLRLLFRCLLSNAVKFRRGSHPQIVVSSAPEGDTAHFRFTDDGIGIPEEFHEDVFLPFRRLHTLDEFPGRGLGLAMARRIVDRYGTRIWLESNPVFGVTVHFTLPARGPA